MPDNALSPREVAKRLEVSAAVIYKWLSLGFFKTAHRIQGSTWVWVVDEADLADPFIIEKVMYARQHGKLIDQGRRRKKDLGGIP